MKNRIKKSLSILLFFLTGCGAVENVSEVEFLSQNNFVEHLRVDSVMLHDSVFIREKSDTVFYTKYRTVYKERLRVDTIVRCDTLYRDREVVVESVRRESVWGKRGLFWKLSIVALLFLLWRTGILRILWNLILKWCRICKRFFHLEG